MDQALRDVHFYGLYHLPRHAETRVNLKKADDPVSTYLRCASLCSESFRTAGYDFSLVTNARDTLDRLLGAQALPPIAMVERTFETKLPPGSPFYSAHFKLDIIGDFAAGRLGRQAALVDIDTVLIRPFESFSVSTSGIVAYDISSQVKPAYGADLIAAEVSDLAGQPFADPAWWGGEFILGSVAGFAALKERLDWLWPRYLDRLGSLHHVGDEIVITAALAMMAADGETVVDAGRAGGVARWWSSRTLSALPPFRALRDRSLFHLPADKPFLSAQATTPFAPDRFLEDYEAMLRRKLAVRRVVTAVEKLMGKRSTKVTPRLA